jgi:hypothetical protein
LPGRQPLEVAPIEERPIRTNNISSKKQSALQEQFGDFWAIYPRKVAKTEALKAFIAVLGDGAVLAAIMAGAAAYSSDVRARRVEAQHIKHASGWLRGRRWEDYGVAAGQTPQSRSRFTTADKAAFRQKHGLQNVGRAEVEAKLRELGELDRWEWER